MNATMSFDDMYNTYLDYRKKSGRKEITIKNLRIFWRYCKKNYPGQNLLTREMVERWTAKRDTETANSNYHRTSPIIGFLKFASNREWLDFDVPEISQGKVSPKIPHFFTEEELRNFFKACDEIEVLKKGGCVKERRLKRIITPVFFRLLYSSGTRTTEARLLRCEDVDLKTGVLTIRHTKGYNEHIVVLHDTMRELLAEYDRAVAHIIPDRKCFFPNKDDKCHEQTWVSTIFNEMWYKYNTVPAVAYDLRHNYAIENINRWVGVESEVHDKLVALSKSMGHTNLESTIYYYSLVPYWHKTIEETTGTNLFDRLIKELPDED